jgi:hypothetical protein
VEGKSFRLADEVRYIQDKAAEHDGRVVSIGQLVLFSTDTGDAWLLDVGDQLAAPLARDGDPEPVHPEETDTSFAIGWKGHYRIEGPAFHLHRSRLGTDPNHPRIPYAEDCASELVRKFQIYLASFPRNAPARLFVPLRFQALVRAFRETSASSAV